MAMSVAEGNKILDCYFNQGNITAPTAIWLSLHTADPGRTGASECADGTYARVNVTAAFPAASAGSVSNDTLIEFAALTTGATITHYGLWTLVSGGVFLHGGDVNPDKVIGAGAIPQFAIGQLTITA